MFGDRLISTEDNQLFRCPYWDCGWCYASIEVETTNDDSGQCNKPLECQYRQELILENIKKANGEKNV